MRCAVFNSAYFCSSTLSSSAFLSAWNNLTMSLILNFLILHNILFLNTFAADYELVSKVGKNVLTFSVRSATPRQNHKNCHQFFRKSIKRIALETLNLRTWKSVSFEKGLAVNVLNPINLTLFFGVTYPSVVTNFL